jgi:hypothetical protein
VAALAPRYDRWQREAVVASYTLTNATAGRVAEMAAAGELEHPSGAPLGPFEIPESSVGSIAYRARLREAKSDEGGSWGDMPARDAVEQFRRRLGALIDRELTRFEIDVSAERKLDLRAVMATAKVTRELAWIPGLDEPGPPRPGAKVNGARQGGETRGLAGKILKAARLNEP